MQLSWGRTGALALLLGMQCAAFAQNPLQVQTDKGTVEGSLTTDGKVRAFKGIPFAAPPVGDLRWREPQSAKAWTGVLEAKQFGSHCMQPMIWKSMVFRDPGQSEDCLTLNVWTPADAKPGSLPVMVWIYGGGYAAGGTSEARQDGQFLAARNVVVVSMNYRLGIFGFFAHPGLTAESPHHASGNYGLLDQALAIGWVKDNIRQFGGDPGNITIFGESAGSFSVNYLTASPLTKDRIAKAIGESGGAMSRAESREEAETAGQKFGEQTLHARTLARLRKVPADRILKAATDRKKHPPHFGPVVDGYLLPDSVAKIFAEGRQAHIPLLAGWTANEGGGVNAQSSVKPTLASFSQQAQKIFGANSDKFLAAYAVTSDETAVRAAREFTDDAGIAYMTWSWLEAHVETGASPVYRYRFDHCSPRDSSYKGAPGAFHSDDIEYVFGTLDSRPGVVWREEDRKLSDLMGAYWTNFARTGNPNGEGLPEWPVYDAAGQWQVMHLNAASEAKPDAARERYLFLDSAWGKPKTGKAAGN